MMVHIVRVNAPVILVVGSARNGAEENALGVRKESTVKSQQQTVQNVRLECIKIKDLMPRQSKYVKYVNLENMQTFQKWQNVPIARLGFFYLPMIMQTRIPTEKRTTNKAIA